VGTPIGLGGLDRRVIFQLALGQQVRGKELLLHEKPRTGGDNGFG